MCGIAGFCDFTKMLTKEILIRMTDVLKHRGPDDSGYSYYENPSELIGLGHRRLSILDLSTQGHQPMLDETGHFEIIYNGEVYNFEELKNDLVESGFLFKSSSDTEIVLKLYIKYGNEFVNKLIGMFAITIYDKRANKLKLFIDRAGVKPLYYSLSADMFLFASELKSFHEIESFKKTIDLSALSLYFKYSYIPAPYSIFNNVKKMIPGTFIEFDIEKRVLKEYKYWDIVEFYNKPKFNKTYNVIKKEVYEILESSFMYRMKSDVPVGVFLSGGYDSTIVAAIIQKNTREQVKTFSIGFESKEINEAPFAKEISRYLGTDHYEYYVSGKDSIDVIPKLAKMFDEPMGDVSSIPTFLVSQLAKSKVTVALSGDGGDEIFGGYSKYFIGEKIYRINTYLPSKKIVPLILNKVPTNVFDFLLNKILNRKITNLDGKIAKLKNVLNQSKIKDFFNLSNQYYTEGDINRLFIEKNVNNYNTIYEEIDSIEGSFLDKVMAIDYKTYMYQILTKVDRASMAVSLESRDPLLDHRIAEYVARIPSKQKFQNGPKGILKDILHDLVPKELLARPKQGFVPPYEAWLRGELKTLVEQFSSQEYINAQKIFNIQEVNRIKTDFYIKGNNGYKLWLLLVFQLWYEEWIVR